MGDTDTRERRIFDRNVKLTQVTVQILVVLGAIVGVYMAATRTADRNTAGVEANATAVQSTRETIAEIKGTLRVQGDLVQQVLIRQERGDAVQHQMAQDVRDIKQAIRDLSKPK